MMACPESPLINRTKDIIKDQLPLKVDKIVLCPLTSEQKRVYETFLALPDVQVMLTHDQPCECGRRDDDGAHYVKGKCCHRGWSKARKLSLSPQTKARLIFIFSDDLEVHHLIPESRQSRRPNLPWLVSIVCPSILGM